MTTGRQRIAWGTAAGRLAFAGGLPPGRGNAGAAPGVDFTARPPAGQAAARPTELFNADVFGCMSYRSPEPQAAR